MEPEPADSSRQDSLTHERSEGARAPSPLHSLWICRSVYSPRFATRFECVITDVGGFVVALPASKLSPKDLTAAPSSVSRFTELLMLSLSPSRAIACEPLAKSETLPASLISLCSTFVTARALNPEADDCEPQFVFASGVLAFAPNELVATLHVLSAIRSLRKLTIEPTTAALPGAFRTPTPLLWT